MGKTKTCPTCGGTGTIMSTENMAPPPKKSVRPTAPRGTKKTCGTCKGSGAV